MEKTGRVMGCPEHAVISILAEGDQTLQAFRKGSYIISIQRVGSWEVSAQDPIPACCDWWHKLYYRKLNTKQKLYNGTNNKMLLIITLGSGLLREMTCAMKSTTIWTQLIIK